MPKMYSAKRVANLMEASQRISEAMQEPAVPDLHDFSWWSDERLLEYFKGTEWYTLPLQNKSDLYDVLDMRGLL